MPQAPIVRKRRGEDSARDHSPIVPNQTYSIREAAAVLGVSVPSIWRWLSDGRISHARLGRRVVFLGSHLLDYLESRTIDKAA
jgi:excisionase family DNA binding protein